MLIRSFAPLAAFTAALGCLHAGCTPMRESAKDIRIGKEIPDPGCRELGPISGSSAAAYVTNETRVNIAQNKLRMNTEELGGNYALMDLVVSGGNGVTISGRALSCPAPRTPARATTAAAAGAEMAKTPAAQVASVDAGAGDAAPASSASSAGDAGSAPSMSAEERLRRLEDLKAKGLITEAEYAAKRQSILDAL